ncbi:MAG TPA: HYR domain-containing protein, partial [Actinomycetes bacterium]
VRCAPASGSFFKLGTATVTCSATDKAGNTATGGFPVTVRDTTPPNLVLPEAIEEDTDSPDGKTVQFTASATDLVDGAVPVTCTPASGSFFKVETATVDCSATDRARNTAKGSFKVTVELSEIGINQRKGPPPRAE